ncbi:zinc finger protein 239-like [Rhinatrema bivittatum]|uniref:zinc finger protein 239-like n=1 Tax=Rhinatrema bivittatum TaxID=194408 RepID=UPI00112C5A22|nr:zinc finger protein 239-like [Rhinatrema bivittatum]XP_029433576.1 zinc finger protein 239-like [Rhinatrema bivittatum]XP_029433577.1 zinc finger protein 239-like [Rhinatrema bivittatum]
MLHSSVAPGTANPANGERKWTTPTCSEGVRCIKIEEVDIEEEPAGQDKIPAREGRALEVPSCPTPNRKGTWTMPAGSEGTLCIKTEEADIKIESTGQDRIATREEKPLEVHTHPTTADETESLHCFECHIIFPDMKAKGRHMKRNHPDEHHLQHSLSRRGQESLSLFPCAFCAKTFPTLETLHIHQAVHPRKGPFACSNCSKSFKKLGNLRIHQLVHKGEEAYECEKCNRAFIHYGNFQIHLRKHEGGPFWCSDCGKSFQDLRRLNIHRKTHTAEKIHECKECGKCFARVSHLTRHLRVHTGEKPFVCEVCGKGFAQPSSLKCHRPVHTGERPYNCGICGRSFSQSSQWYKHKKTHKEGKELGDATGEVLP